MSLFKFIITFLIIGCLTTSRVFAHEVTTQPLLLANNKDILVENSSPMTSVLPWAEHIIDQNLTPGEAIALSFDTTVATNELNFDPSTTFVTWTSSDGQTKSGAGVSFKFATVGSYFISIKAQDNYHHTYDEKIEITVGQKIAAADIIVGSNNQILELREGTTPIDRHTDYDFKVMNPNTDKYSYDWDMGEQDTSNGTSVSKIFTKTKLPVYIVLRTTDKSTHVFADSYVRLEGDSNPDFSVVTPATPQLSGSQPLLNSNIIWVAVALAVIGLGGKLALSVYQKSRKHHTDL